MSTDPAHHSTRSNTAAVNTATVNTAAGKLAVGWALVGVPLAYGVYETLTRVAALFG